MEGPAPGPTFIAMNTMKVSVAVAAALWLCHFKAAAQDYKFEMTFSGVCVSNAVSGPNAGKFAASTYNTASILAPYAQANGLRLQDVALIYHLNSDPEGDTIEVINRTNGVFLGKPFALLFGDDYHGAQNLGRMGLTNSVGTQVRKIHYVYTDQNSHSMGSCLLSEHFDKDANGTVTNGLIMGAMSWIVVPDGTQPMQVYNGSLFTSRMLSNQ